MADGYGQQQQPGSPESSPHSENESGGGHYQDASVREQDRFLPIANVSRIMKKALPSNAKISKDAKETVQECVSEFISFITGEASDKCQREKRKTINGDDLLWAMSTLGFEDYVEPLKVYLHKYRELEGEKASTAKQGDQSGGKEVNQGGMPSMNVGMQSAMNGGMNSMSGGPINGGMHPAAMPMMQQQYGQQQQPPPGMMYAPTHQMMSQYQQMPMQNGPGQPRGI